jgi:hypothetical protein
VSQTETLRCERVAWEDAQRAAAEAARKALMAAIRKEAAVYLIQNAWKVRGVCWGGVCVGDGEEGGAGSMRGRLANAQIARKARGCVLAGLGKGGRGWAGSRGCLHGGQGGQRTQIAWKVRRHMGADGVLGVRAGG